MSAALREMPAEPPPLDAAAEARVAYLVEREVTRRLSALNRERFAMLDRLEDALFRAAVIVGRAVKPGKRWDGL